MCTFMAEKGITWRSVGITGEGETYFKSEITVKLLICNSSKVLAVDQAISLLETLSLFVYKLF